MISGKYYKYRNIFYCMYCDFMDAIMKALGRKKKAPEETRITGYGRWVNLEQGGGIDMGIPGLSEKRKFDKKNEGKADGGK